MKWKEYYRKEFASPKTKDYLIDLFERQEKARALDNLLRTGVISSFPPHLNILRRRCANSGCIGIGLTSWLYLARLARGMTLSVREKDFVEVARAEGAGNFRIIFRHILPSVIGPCLVQVMLQIPGFILYEAFLSFIGLGVNPPTPSWGMMINEGYQGMRSHFNLIAFPALALSLTMFAFNFLGDGLRDALDPRMRR